MGSDTDQRKNTFSRWEGRTLFGVCFISVQNTVLEYSFCGKNFRIVTCAPRRHTHCMSVYVYILLWDVTYAILHRPSLTNTGYPEAKVTYTYTYIISLDRDWSLSEVSLKCGSCEPVMDAAGGHCCTNHCTFFPSLALPVRERKWCRQSQLWKPQDYRAVEDLDCLAVMEIGLDLRAHSGWGCTSVISI